MKRPIAAALLACALLLDAARPSAETLDSTAAMTLLLGSTWAGVNESGQSFWFWHVGGPDSGRFAAKFAGTGGEADYHKGRWAKQAGEVCWTWPAWQATYCYVAFRLEGGELALVRRDGVVHRGSLTPGNSENLVP